MTLELAFLTSLICATGVICSIFYIVRFVIIRCVGKLYNGLVSDSYKIEGSEGFVYKTRVSYMDENGTENNFIDPMVISYSYKIGAKVLVVLRKDPKLEILWSLPRVFGPPMFVLLISGFVALHSNAVFFLIDHFR